MSIRSTFTLEASMVRLAHVDLASLAAKKQMEISLPEKKEMLIPHDVSLECCLLILINILRLFKRSLH